MRRKQFFVALVLLMHIFTSQFAWADVTNLKEGDGWVRLTQQLPSELDKYYFIFADFDNALMLQLRYGNQQGNAYNTAWYREANDPVADPSLVWTLENDHSGSLNIDFQVIRSLAYQQCFLQQESSGTQYFRTHDNGGGNKSWGRTLIEFGENGCATIKDRNRENYLGAPGNVARNAEVVFNKAEENRGRFVVYAISREKYNELRQSRIERATPDTPQNVSWLIQDCNLELTADASSWTDESGGISRGGSDANHIARYFNKKGKFSQKLYGIPNGIYRVKVQGFYREGDNTNAYNLNQSNSEHGYGVLFAESETASLKSIFIDAKDAKDDANGFNQQVGDCYIPDGSSYSANAFASGAYTGNEITVNVMYHELTLGVMNTNSISNDYTVFDSFELWYYGPDSSIDWMNMDLGIIDLENAKVKAFLQNADYRRQGATSVIKTYSDGSSDCPTVITVPFPDCTCESSLVLTVSNLNTFDGTDNNTRVVNLDLDATHYDIYNLLPGYTYYYKVEADGNVVSKGQFSTIGMLRMMNTEGSSNFRDMGGRMTIEGRKVKYGRLYRGGELHDGKETNLSDAGLAEMKRLGIRAELDLRKIADIKNGVAPVKSAIPDCDYRFEDMSTYASDFFDAQADRDRIRDSFNFIAKHLEKDDNVYFHCIWGADRTGGLALLLGATLGYTMNDLYQDYELTSFSKAGIREKNGSQFNIEGKIIYIQEHCNGNNFMEQTIDCLERICGVPADTIQAIRNALLEDSDESKRVLFNTLKADYENVIAVAGAEWNVEGVTAIEDLTREYERAMNALTGEIDITNLLVNPNFSSSTSGWSVMGSLNCNGDNKVVEIVGNKTSLRQAVNNLPSGIYTMKVQGYQRTADVNSAWEYYSEGQNKVSSSMILNQNRKMLKNIFADAQDEIVRSSDNVTPDGKYVPGTTSGAGMYFDKNLYNNSFSITLSSTSNLIVGMETTDINSASQTCLDNVRLFYRGASYVPEKLTFIDGEQCDDIQEGVFDITYKRTFNNTEWQPLYVPFSISYSDWADDFDVAAINNFHEYTNDDGELEKVELEVRYVKNGNLKPNRPYLIRAHDTGDKTITLNGVTLCQAEENSISCSSTERKYTFTGTYHAVMGLKNKGYIYLSGGRLCMAENDEQMLKAQRWYLSVKDYDQNVENDILPLQSLAPMRISVLGEEESVTGMDDILVITSPSFKGSEQNVSGIYDLSGRRVLDMKKGISIVRFKDGSVRKFFVK